MTTINEAREKSSVTFNDGRTATLYYDSKITQRAFENVNITDPNAVKNTVYDKYVRSADKGKDRSILEANDLSAKEKLEYAKLNGYDKYYDMEIVDYEGEQCLQITLKDCRAKIIGTRTPLTDITSDFGIKDMGILRKYNPDYVSRYSGNQTQENGTLDWNSMSAVAGEKFRLPIEKIDVTGGIQGFARKLFAK